MRSSKTFLISLLAAAVPALAALPAMAQAGAAGTNKAAPSLDDFITDKVIAKGKGFDVKRSEMDLAMINAKANAAAAGRPVQPSELASLEVKTLDYLLLLRMLNEKATDAQKARGKEEAEKVYDMYKKRAQTDEALAQELKAVGLTPQTFHKGLIEEQTGHFVMAARVKVTDEQVKTFYEGNPSAFEVPEQALINFIRLGGPDPLTHAPISDERKKEKRKQIDELRDRALKGEDFEKLAREYSEHEQAKQTGGEFPLNRGGHQVPPEFETAAFLLQTNEISPVITIEDGYHLIKLKQKTPARKKSLAEVETDLKNYLENREIEAKLPEVYQELKKDYTVEIVDDRLKLLEEVMAAESAKQPAPSGAKPKDK